MMVNVLFIWRVLGKYAMPQLVSKLPPANRSSELPLSSNDTITAVESAIYEIIKTNSTHAKYVISSMLLFILLDIAYLNLWIIHFMIYQSFSVSLLT